MCFDGIKKLINCLLKVLTKLKELCYIFTKHCKSSFNRKQFTSVFYIVKQFTLKSVLLRNKRSLNEFRFTLNDEGRYKQDEGRYKLEVIEYNDGGSTGDEKSVVEFKPSKPITYHPFPFLCDTWGSLKISSCNGLVFMGSDKPNINTLVCNPFTREYVHLRIPTRLLLERNGYMAYGFGYLPSTNEYKVVSIYYDNVKTEAGKNKGMVRVYTLGSGKWRNKGKIPCWIINTPFYPGGFANGAIHWFTENHEIVSFNLANEEFRLVVSLPPPARSPNYAVPLPPSARSRNYVVQYGVLGGCLCVTRSDGRAGRKEIWVLNVLTANNNKDIKFSWNKKFSIPIWNRYNTDEATTARVLTKSGNILLCGGSNSDLVSCDPKTEKFVFGKHFRPSKWVKVIPCTKSFVSLKALGEEYAKCWRFDDNNNSLSKEFVSSQSTWRRRRKMRRFYDNA